MPKLAFLAPQSPDFNDNFNINSSTNVYKTTKVIIIIICSVLILFWKLLALSGFETQLFNLWVL
jgi:hypothetical protein